MEWTIVRIAILSAFVLLLLSAGIEDARTREIADRKNIAIALIAPLWWWASGVPVWPDMAMRIAVAITVFLLFAQAFRIGMMGGGDMSRLKAMGGGKAAASDQQNSAGGLPGLPGLGGGGDAKPNLLSGLGGGLPPGFNPFKK